MLRSLKDLDRVLRGEATRPSALQEQTIAVQPLGMAAVVLVLGMLYGICMGCYAIFGIEEPELRQTLSSMLKVPALFFLTLLVTFPSLYVFNALVGSRLTLPALLRLLIAAMGVNLAVLASLGTIVAFFSVSTTSYPFMVLLNVAVFAVSGVIGLTFLLQTLHRMGIALGTTQRPDSPKDTPPDDADAEPDPDSDPEAADVDGGPEVPFHDPTTPLPMLEPELAEEPGALDRIADHTLGRHVKKVFGCWIIVFGLVGAQMGWVLRPFIGSPEAEFQWFRQRESNFFEAVARAIGALFS